MFKISVYTEEYNTVYVQDYTAVPQSDNNKATGFQQVALGGMDSMRFILPSSFVHHTFMVNTDDIHLNHYSVNDLINPQSLFAKTDYVSLEHSKKVTTILKML